MKLILTIATAAWLSAYTAVAQSLNHPVIEKVQVIYKPVKSLPDPGQGSGPASPNISVNGTTHISLRSVTDVARIYLRIKDKQNQMLIYEVNYAVNASDVSGQGLMLCKQEGNVISITNPSVFNLKPYVYELYTEDPTGRKSSIYTIIQ